MILSVKYSLDMDVENKNFDNIKNWNSLILKFFERISSRIGFRPIPHTNNAATALHGTSVELTWIINVENSPQLKQLSVSEVFVSERWFIIDKGLNKNCPQLHEVTYAVRRKNEDILATEFRSLLTFIKVWLVLIYAWIRVQNGNFLTRAWPRSLGWVCLFMFAEFCLVG